MAALLDLANRGTIRAKELDEIGVPRTYLRRLCERGELVQVDRGIYRLPDAEATELHTIAQVAKRVPRGVICLLSALQLHELTTEAPHAVWIQIGRKDRAPSFRTPRLEVVRASGLARTHGIESRVIEGVRINVTSAAKTVADCFRYRRRVGIDIAVESLRDYLRRRPRRSIDALVAAARADRVLAVMRPYLEALS